MNCYYNQFNQQIFGNVFPSAPPALVYPTQETHSITEKLIQKAKQISLGILGHSSPIQATSPHNCHFFHSVPLRSVAPFVNIDCSNRSVNMFNHQTSIQSEKKELNSKKESALTARIVLAVLGVIIGTATAYLMGKEIAQAEEATEEKHCFEDLKIHWKLCRHDYNAQCVYQGEVDNIVFQVDFMMKRQEIDRIQGLALLMLGFAAGGAAVVGALIGSKVIMMSAIVLGTATVFTSLFKLGYNAFSHKDQREAQEILFSADKLLNQTVYVQN